MQTVVTGGAGHVGTNLVNALLADGHEVRVVDIRPPSRPLGAQWIRADVRDEPAMRRAFSGAEVVYHLAAVISVAGGLGGRVWSVNVDGCRSVAAAAGHAGVGRLVHCSSVHAFDLRGGQVVDESCPRAVAADLPAYDRSKAAGEEQIRRAMERGLDAVCLNPTGIIGPEDNGPSRMGTVLRAMWRRRLPAIVDGGFDWVDVRDVVSALRAAADRGLTGESYLVAGHRLSIAALATLAGVTSRTAPTWLLRSVAPAATVLARYGGGALMPTRDALHALHAFPAVCGAKAERELGHRPRPMAETLADLRAHFVARGQLRIQERDRT